MKKLIGMLAAAGMFLGMGLNPAAAATRTSDPGTYTIFATNDLGIHCVCFVDDIMTMLPPWNTIRTQVMRVDGRTHQAVSDASKIKVEYSVPFAQNNLDDPAYQAYLANINKTYPEAEGWAHVDAANPVSVAGTPLAGGNLTAEPEHNMWKVDGIPVFPPIVAGPGEGVFQDPLGTYRQAFPAITITVKDVGTGEVLAQRTDVTTPVAFANCCTCHKEIYHDKFGTYAEPLVTFRETVINAHDVKYGTDLGPLVDSGTPIRCSRCHSDPAVGGATPGYPTGLYPAAAGLSLPTSAKTLSYVIHEGHNKKPDFHTHVSTLGFGESCEACHPGKETVGCLRGVHVTQTTTGQSMDMKCSDCHGDLSTRAATGQLDDPWSYRTLPRCSNCHSNRAGIEWTTEEIDAYGHQQFGGAFLNSRGHKNDVWLCTTCHGSPHALAPSNISFEQDFYKTFNNGVNAAIGRCGTCHNSKKEWGEPPH